MKVIGISGKKQSGKNTMANYIHGRTLKSASMIMDFGINNKGELSIFTTNSQGKEGWGIFDVSRKDYEFVQYAERELWPYVKLYSFADGLKRLCIEFFGLTPEQVYGTDEHKNTSTNILWKDMPFDAESRWMINKGASNYMTAREFMQYFGTDIMRKIYTSVHTDYTTDSILNEQSKLAIVADVRFPNEVEAIKNIGGKVVRLNRNNHGDNHGSETALDEENYDWENFDIVIDNASCNIEDFCSKIDNAMAYFV
jgi:hypothetical protein